MSSDMDTGYNVGYYRYLSEGERYPGSSEWLYMHALTDSTDWTHWVTNRIENTVLGGVFCSRKGSGRS